MDMGQFGYLESENIQSIRKSEKPKHKNLNKYLKIFKYSKAQNFIRGTKNIQSFILIVEI